MSKALIVYGTRYGAAASTSKEIAKMLRQEGFEVRVVDAKNEKVKRISEYDLVIVGSGIQINRWTHEPEKFLKDFHEELTRKNVALFVCCGSASQAQTEGNPLIAEKARKRYLEEKAAKYGLRPLAVGLFGGVFNYNKIPWYARKAMEAGRAKIEAAYKETEPGIYDTRDWNSIRAWTKKLAEQVDAQEPAAFKADTSRLTAAT